MRFLWLPLAYLQDGLGGKAKAITTAVMCGVTALILLMVFCPFPLKMEANGQFLPIDRAQVFAPINGRIEDIQVTLKSGSKVTKGQQLFVLSDGDLAKQVFDLRAEIETLQAKINPNPGKGPDSQDKQGVDPVAVEEAKITLRHKNTMLQKLRERTNAEIGRPGFFKINSPKAGIVLSDDFRDNLLGRQVKPSDPLIMIGFTDPDRPKRSDWELKLKIPQKHVGQILRAFENLPAGSELDVDVLVMSMPDAGSFRAKLRKDKIAAQANPQKDDNNEAEPVVIAWARIDGDDIPDDRRIPPALLLSGSEVHTRIRCGNRPMGYALFYGVYEFAYEKVIFPYAWWN
jgi:hypothetical protein